MPPDPAARASANAHRAQFYDDTAFLAGRVAEFFAGALIAGGASICVARPEHREAIATALVRCGIDVAAMRSTGRLIEIDAGELLTRFLVDDLPDRARFRAVVVEQLTTARQAGNGAVHIYGEMVDLLWGAQRAEAVLRLEDLWNELGTEQQFMLLCGYRLKTFAAERHIEMFHEVCGRHGQIAPSEQLAHISQDPEANRAIAELEQRARALESEIERRGRMELRLEQLLEVSGEIGGAISREEVARIAIDEGIAAVGASYGGLWKVDAASAQLKVLAMSRLPRGEVRGWSAVPLDLDAPAPHVARTGEPLFLESLAEYRAQFPASFERIAETMTSSELAYALVPIASDGEVLGVLTLMYENVRSIDSSERTFLSILARQCGLAFERIRLYEAERATRLAAEAGRAKSELLYELTASCNQIEDLATVYELALHTVERGTKSDRAAVLLFDHEHVLRFEAADGLSPTYRQAVEGHSPWTSATTDPEPIIVADTELDPAWAAYRDTFRAEGIRCAAFIPLVHHRRLLGKVMLYRDRPEPFTRRQVQFAQLVAVQVAQAVDRAVRAEELARSLREVRAAHHEAEEATRAREEILSVVSHDLRNPLGTILMGASSLLQVADPGDKRFQRTHTTAQRIHRQAERMARLIEDLVDFAGIQAGRLAIERARHAPGEIIAQASDMFGPMALERGLAFEAASAPGLPAIECDSDRAIQVIANLLTNALKVTPRGGSIAIGAKPLDDEIVFFVRDTGPGIDPDDLPRLFERYWRSKQATYKGAGLGLSIARGIVDAHGGRIWAESQVGAGSTFYFSLQSARSN